MNNVLVITSNFFPEVVGIGPYSTDLTENLCDYGARVVVLTSRPYYPEWRERKKESWVEYETRNAFVYRGKHFKARSGSIIPRIIFEVSLSLSLISLVKRNKSKEFEKIVCIIPSLACGFAAIYAKKIMKLPLSIIVQDITYLGLIESGIKGGKLISLLGKILEKIVLNQADSICCISKPMKDEVAKLTRGKIQIEYIPNYRIGKDLDEPEGVADSRNPESIRYILSCESPGVRFRLLYTGAISNKQALSEIVETAENLKKFPEVVIHIIGAGSQMKDLKLRSRNLGNLHIHNLVPAKDYKHLLNLADVLLVSERNTVRSMALPSKIINYLFSTKPIIAFVPVGSATWNFLEGMATRVNSESPSQLANAIQSIYENPENANRLANQGFRFATRELDSDKGWQKYRAWLFNSK
jgi:glycosyltransferase involved in cell wall biosynthesis